MPHVVTKDCVKDMACIKVCPQNAFYDAGEMLVINPEECMDCGLCVQECPSQAIYPADDIPADKKECVDLNKKFFEGKAPADLEKVRQTP